MFIYINPGHGPDNDKDKGACNYTLKTGTTITEYSVVKQIANQVVSKLNSSSIPAKYICDSNVNNLAVASTKDDIFVSIHLNALSPNKATGTETWYKPSSTESQKLASAIQNNVVSTLKLSNRGIKPSYNGWAVVDNNNTDKCALVEVGFVDNDSDLQKILNSLDDVSTSIADAINSYYINVSKDTTSTTSNTTSKIAGAQANANETTSTDNTDDSTASYDVITKFMDLLSTNYFYNQFNKVFSQTGYSTLWAVLTQFLKYFFYSVYSIPNLPNNKVLVVKPETFFGVLPTCNIIVPCMKDGISYSRSYKLEPTRLFLKTSPLSITGQKSLVTIGTVVGIDTEENSTNEKVVKFTSPQDAKSVADMPMFKITDFENKYGIRISESYGGNELFTFLLSKENNAFDIESSKNKLTQLAKYLLLQSRFMQRSGTISMVFNPYIAVGFPFVSLENTDLTEKALTVYGYITSVSHTIDPNSWSTAISYTYGHTDSDPTPTTLPIVEDMYGPTKGISGANAIYKEIFGEEVKAVDPTKVEKDYKDYTAREMSLETIYGKIRRTASTLQSYIKDILGGGEVLTNKNYTYIKSDAYREDVQKVIMAYSTRVYNDKLAFSVNDGR